MTEATQPSAPESQPVASEGQEDTNNIANKVAEEQARKIWKLKADGEEFDFDATDEETVKREISKARGASKRLQEAATARKQVEAFLKGLKEDPKSILKNPKLGLDAKKIAEEILWEAIQEEQLTPEQRASRDRDRELEEFKAREREAKEREEKEHMSAVRKQYAKEYETKIMDALKDSSLPKNNYTVRRTAFYLHHAAKNGLGLDVKDVLQLVEKDYKEEHGHFYGNADAEFVEKWLGSGIAKKLRERDLKQLKNPMSEGFSTESRTGLRQPPKKEPVKRLSPREWEKKVQQLLG